MSDALDQLPFSSCIFHILSPN